MSDSMKQIRIEKLTLNFGSGTDQKKLEKGIKLIKAITGITPVKTVTSKRIPTWGLRPGLAIGCKLTLRGEKASELLEKFIAAKEKQLSLRNFDGNGNISFGIHEYVDIPGVKYDPELGIIGLEISVTLARPGFRIKLRKIKKRKISHSQRINRVEAVNFFKERFSITIKEEQDDL